MTDKEMLLPLCAFSVAAAFTKWQTKMKKTAKFGGVNG